MENDLFFQKLFDKILSLDFLDFACKRFSKKEIS